MPNAPQHSNLPRRGPLTSDDGGPDLSTRPGMATYWGGAGRLSLCTRAVDLDRLQHFGGLHLLALGSTITDGVCRFCAGPTRVFAMTIGTDGEMCLKCSAKKQAERTQAEKGADLSWFQRRLFLTGVPQRTVEQLGITAHEPKVRLQKSHDGRWSMTAAAVNIYLQHARPGTLVLSGDTGLGKSCAAAFAAWHSHGLFLERARWTKVKVRSGDDSQLRHVINHAGVVVLDDCMHVRPGGDPGDSDWESEVVFEIAQTRHEAMRATVLTTQATRKEVETAYGTRGEALARRADDGLDLAKRPNAGGWVDCVWSRK